MEVKSPKAINLTRLSFIRIIIYFQAFTDYSSSLFVIEDCEKFHRAIDPLLDEADPISEAYILEVSSPGIERELKTAAHIEACEGWDVEVKLYAPKNGSKMYRGVLCGYDDEGNITIEVGEEKLAFKPDEVAKIATYYDFGN